MLRQLKIENLGPIESDCVDLESFTYFIGRNNAGKSHYLLSIEALLAQKMPTQEEMFKLQRDPDKFVEIEGVFDDVRSYLPLLEKSNHRKALEACLDENGLLRVVRRFKYDDKDNSTFGVRKPGEEKVENPCGTASNLLMVLPEPIPIVATADTVEELKTKSGSAIEKLKREVMSAFFVELQTRTASAMKDLDHYLHADDPAERCVELAEFERDLKAEMAGEFRDVVPTVEFDLPGEEVIAKEMKIILDDGHKSEVEQKGHGLQRATLLALLRLLARRGKKYQNRPAPLFLVGEIETYLHPYAQLQLAESLRDLVDDYQVLTSTHSPFVIAADHLRGLRRVSKATGSTKAITPDWKDLDEGKIKRHLEWRWNLEGLFADRIVLVEGQNDEGFYDTVRKLLGVEFPARKFTVFVRTQGKKQLSVMRGFYRALGMEDVAVIGDLDYLYGRDARFLCKALGLDPARIDEIRAEIGWTSEKDPKLGQILEKVNPDALPKRVAALIEELKPLRVFVLQHGSPEHYSVGTDAGDGWQELASESDLSHVDYLRSLLTAVCSG